MIKATALKIIKVKILKSKNKHKFSEEDSLGNVSMKARTYSDAGNSICTMCKKACNLCQYCSNNTSTVALNSKEALINNKNKYKVEVKSVSSKKSKLRSLLQLKNQTKQKRGVSKF